MYRSRSTYVHLSERRVRKLIGAGQNAVEQNDRVGMDGHDEMLVAVGRVDADRIVVVLPLGGFEGDFHVDGEASDEPLRFLVVDLKERCLRRNDVHAENFRRTV